MLTSPFPEEGATSFGCSWSFWKDIEKQRIRCCFATKLNDFLKQIWPMTVWFRIIPISIFSSLVKFLLIKFLFSLLKTPVGIFYKLTKFDDNILVLLFTWLRHQEFSGNFKVWREGESCQLNLSKSENKLCTMQWSALNWVGCQCHKYLLLYVWL